MNRTARHVFCAVVMGGLAVTGSRAPAADRTAVDILTDIEKTVMPKPDAAKARCRIHPAVQRRSAESERDARELILELYKAAPRTRNWPRCSQRWLNRTMLGEKPQETYKEVCDVVEHTKNEKLKVEGAYVKAVVKLMQGRKSGQFDLADLNEFIKVSSYLTLAPASLLYSAAGMTKDEKAKIALEDRLVSEFPKSKVASRVVGMRRKKDAVGKPFDLEFADAITGSTVSIKT